MISKLYNVILLYLRDRMLYMLYAVCRLRMRQDGVGFTRRSRDNTQFRRAAAHRSEGSFHFSRFSLLLRAEEEDLAETDTVDPLSGSSSPFLARNKPN